MAHVAEVVVPPGLCPEEPRKGINLAEARWVAALVRAMVEMPAFSQFLADPRTVPDGLPVLAEYRIAHKVRGRKLHASFRYRAKGWDCDRRVVSKVEWHAGELFPRVGFIVTNSEAPPHRVVQFYNGRGKAEQYVKEGKYATSWTRLSCHRFEANAVRLQTGSWSPGTFRI